MRKFLSLSLASSLVCVAVMSSPVGLLAQDATPATAPVSVVPHLIRYSGSLPDAPAAASVVQVKFALYAEQTGGEALWSEQQQVALDPASKYSVLLGSTSEAGLPHDLFATGQARWLGVTLEGAAESPRTLLVAAPYSLKASDAETLGGHPASDFALAKPDNGKPETATAITTITGTNGILVNNTTNGSGTGPTVALALDLSYVTTLGNSAYAQINAANTFHGNQTVIGNYISTGALTTNGTTSKLAGGGGVDISYANGIYTFALDAPTATSFGNALWAQLSAANTLKGTQTLAALGTATSSTKYNSNAVQFTGSAYNSSASAAEAINFSLQAEPTANDTASPAGTLNLLYSTGTNAPAETGLSIASNGKITFATGQTFPGTGTGNGTITGITTTSPLSGSGTSGSVALSLNTSSLETTLNTVYPQLGAADTYTAAQTIDSTETISGTVASGKSFGSLAGQLTVNDTSTSATAIPVAIVANTSIGLGVEGIGAIGLYGYAPPSTQYVSYGVEGSGTDEGGYFTAPDGGTASGAVNGTGVFASGYTGGSFTGDTSAGSGITAFGYYGFSGNGVNAGVDAGNGSLSAIGTQYQGYGITAGLYADTSAISSDGAGAMVTAQDTWSILLANDSPSGYPAMEVENNDTTGAGSPFQAYNVTNNTYCRIDESADLACSGTASVVHNVEGRSLKTYGVQSAENWIEDFGSGQLNSGSTHIALDARFAGTVNTQEEYHVFLTPRGESEGLYVAHAGADGFDVVESHGGKSNVGFDYRIVAKRKGYETVRMEDVTAVETRMKAQHDAMRARSGKVQVHHPAMQPAMPKPGTLTERATLTLPKP